MSCFQFLQPFYPEFYHNALMAEKLVFIDPSSSLAKSRLIAEKVTALMLQYESISKGPNHFENIQLLDSSYVLPDLIKENLHLIRKSGNKASHDGTGNRTEASFILKLLYQFVVWFVEKYEDEDLQLPTYTLKEPLNTEEELKQQLVTYAQQVQDYEAKIAQFQQQAAPQKQQRRLRGQQLASRIQLTELDTRITLIDEMLRKAGWECDSILLNNKEQNSLPEKGKNRAIAEWPCNGKWADYALFNGLELIGIVEAKAYAKDISSNLDQSRLYAANIVPGNSFKILGQWNQYHVPFLFSTNGRSYSEQLRTKSGVWFLDIRNPYHTARPLENFYSPQGLQDLLKQDIGLAEQKLGESDYDYLRAASGLGLREYQIKAIEAVEKKIREQPEQRTALIVMATGTGKTRTIGGLLYRLIKANRFKRILFLTDRTLLASQARDSIKDNKIEDLQSFADIYAIANLDEQLPDAETRLQFATVQSMVKRVFFSETPLPVDFYDCIVVDEAHRGYILDREFAETDLHFTNEADYIGQYKKLLFYFDAWKIGLTATPALHTSQLFGDPVYGYSYRAAVVDGFLVDFEPPYIISTQLNSEGITVTKGEMVKMFDPENNTLEELAHLEDELQYNVEAFNTKVLTPTFNEAVIGELVNHIDPDGEAKTLIFAARDSHADELVTLLYKKYAEIGVDVHQEAIQKITGTIKDPEGTTRLFKNERYPNIVVTVDLLTTGIDVPKIDTLVFMRAVKSRILYEQMIGRATRLCPEIGKESFRIFDAVRIYETMKEVTQMTAVTNPSLRFEELAAALADTPDQTVAERIIEQLVAKLQRKKSRLTEEQLNQFTFHTQMNTPDELIQQLLQHQSPAQMQALVATCHNLWAYLDTKVYRPVKYLYVDAPDTLQEVSRGYGKGTAPDDYIESFKTYIETNKNKIAALELVVTKPSQLDKASLRDLKLLLDNEGFSETKLNTAWKAKTQQDIAADIIAYIRTLSLGSHLISKNDRVKTAIQKIKTSHTFNLQQVKWIDRFEKYLLAETILKKQDLDAEPFKQDGGFTRLNKIFNNDLENLITELNEYLFTG